jgi:undecaprenyl-diphosphatase
MLELIQHLIHWIHLHPHWAALISFIIAFTESLAIVGLFIPGSMILCLIGGLVGAGILPASPILICAVLGAIGGDGLSYWLGYHYHQRIRAMWPFYKFIGLLNKGEQFFNKHGGKSVFLGRFLGPLRPVIPMIAGMMNLSPMRFLGANVLSALLWAPGYILLGVLIGQHIVAISPHHAGKILAEITIVLILFWLCYWLLRQQIINFFSKLNLQLQARWLMVENKLLKSMLRDAELPNSHRQVWLAIGVLSSGFAFLLLFAILTAGINVQVLNAPIYHVFSVLYRPTIHTVMTGITLLGEKFIILPVSILIWIYLLLRKKTRLAWHFLILIFVTVAALSVFKHLAHYPRPENVAAVIKEYSFPSGHVGLTVVFWGFLGWIFTQKTTNPHYRHRIAAVVCFIVLMVMVSRLYLGMHWLTDVIGALFLGLTCLSMAILVYRRSS